MFLIRSALVAMLALVSACAAKAPPPPPISSAQFSAYRLANVSVDTSEAVISWPAAEREFAASKGIAQATSSSTIGERDDFDVSDEERAAFTAYDEAIKSDEAQAYYRERVAGAMKPRLTEALSPAFKGDKPLNMTVALKNFSIRSSAAIAFGGDEAVVGSIDFAEADAAEPIAQSTDLAYVSKNDAVVPAAGGLAGLAIALAVSAAINVASDAVADSDDHLSKNYAQVTRDWLQLEPYEFAE